MVALGILIVLPLDILVVVALTVRWHEARSVLRSRLSNPTSTPKLSSRRT